MITIFGLHDWTRLHLGGLPPFWFHKTKYLMACPHSWHQVCLTWSLSESLTDDSLPFSALLIVDAQIPVKQGNSRVTRAFLIKCNKNLIFFIFQHNTHGINCEKCKVYFYRPVDKNQSHSDACKGKKVMNCSFYSFLKVVKDIGHFLSFLLLTSTCDKVDVCLNLGSILLQTDVNQPLPEWAIRNKQNIAIWNVFKSRISLPGAYVQNLKNYYAVCITTRNYLRAVTSSFNIVLHLNSTLWNR